jgi:hypothetical protein
MGKALLTLSVACLFLMDPACRAQSSVKISDPRLEYRDNKLYISYDILNGDPGEQYRVRVDIMDQEGNVMDAGSLAGDLGLIEEGGNNKQVTWDLEADDIFIDAYVYVKINAQVIPPPEPEISQNEDAPAEDTDEIAQSGSGEAGTPVTGAGETGLPDRRPEEEEKTSSQSDAGEVEGTSAQSGTVEEEASPAKEPPPESGLREFNRTGIIIQSLALPGLGLSRVTGKPHWIRGVAGYGCVAGAIVLNRMAINDFNTIKDLENVRDVNDAFDRSVRRDQISEVMAYTAVGIWAADLVWTILGTADLKQNPFSSETAGFAVKGNLDPLSCVPMISIRYQF